MHRMCMWVLGSKVRDLAPSCGGLCSWWKGGHRQTRKHDIQLMLGLAPLRVILFMMLIRFTLAYNTSLGGTGAKSVALTNYNKKLPDSIPRWFPQLGAKSLTLDLKTHIHILSIPGFTVRVTWWAGSELCTGHKKRAMNDIHTQDGKT